MVYYNKTHVQFPSVFEIYCRLTLLATLGIVPSLTKASSIKGILFLIIKYLQITDYFFYAYQHFNLIQVSQAKIEFTNQIHVLRL